MTLTDRTTTYSPAIDLILSYPSWLVTTAAFPEREFSHVVCWAEKTIIVDPGKFCDDDEWALAHVVHHLDEHMDRLDSLTVADCEAADFVAKVRLDRECDRLPGCGDQPH